MSDKLMSTHRSDTVNKFIFLPFLNWNVKFKISNRRLDVSEFFESIDKVIKRPDVKDPSLQTVGTEKTFTDE